MSMTAKKKAKSKPMSKAKPTGSQKNSILQTVHESAKDLHAAGLIDKTTMRDFDVLCLPAVPQYTPRQIQKIRNRYNASQAVFARYMNVTTSSLQKWEAGTKRPTGVALKLLSLGDKKGLEVLLY